MDRPSPLRALAWTVLLVVPLAGCAGPDPGSDPGQTTHGTPDPAAAGELAMPTWAVRDHWTYAVNGEPTTYVITGETTQAWTMETDSPERAFADARDDISRLGPQRKSDLAGSQGDDVVWFFQWPLRANATWTTRWDHQDVTVRVLDVGDGVAHLEARNATAVQYLYTYDAAAGWFGDLRRLAADGSDLVHLTLSGSGRNWTGTVVRWDLVTLFEDVADVTFRTVDVAVGTTDLWLGLEAHCTGGAGGYTLAIGPADAAAGSETFTASEQCTDRSLAEPIAQAPVPGQWLVSWNGNGQPDASLFHVELLQRTRTDVAVA